MGQLNYWITTEQTRVWSSLITAFEDKYSFYRQLDRRDNPNFFSNQNVTGVFFRSSYSWLIIQIPLPSWQQSPVVFPRCTIHIFSTSRVHRSWRIFALWFSPILKYVPYEEKNLKIPSENKMESTKPSGFIQTSDITSSTSETAIQGRSRRFCSKNSISATKTAFLRNRWLCIEGEG